MKKKLNLIIMMLIAALLLTACGAASQESAAYDMAAKEEVMEETVVEEEFLEFSTDSTASTTEAPASGVVTQEQAQQYAEKIIYSGHVNIETTDFDASITALNKAVTEYGGFVQDSNVSGRSNGDRTAVVDRYAYYVVRIPTKRFEEFMALTGDIGNVTSSGRSAENVTSQYTDYEARLTSLYTQEERLLSMLGTSGDLESLIALEQRLSEVRYEIESIERNLRNLDQKLAYSTISIDLHEVEIYTPTAAVQRSFGEKLADAFSDGWRGFSRGLQGFVIGFAAALPTLVLLAVIAAVVIVVVRKRVKKKKQQPKEEPKE